MSDPKQRATPVQVAGAVAGAVAAASPTISYSTQTMYGTGLAMQGTTMPSQDHALLEARIDARIAEHRGDLKLNTQGIAELKSRFDDLANRMSTVPVDIGVLKTKVEALPGKGFVVTAAVGTVGALTAVIVLLRGLGLLQ